MTGRGLRGTAAGAVAALGSVLAHVSAGASAPTGPVVAVLLAGCVAGGLLLAGRRLRAPSVVALAILAQAGLHLAQLLTAPGHESGTLTGMVLGHGVIAALTATVVLLGEHAWWRLLALAGLVPMRLADRIPTPQVRVGSPVPVPSILLPVRRLWRRTKPRRGPPRELLRPA